MLPGMVVDRQVTPAGEFRLTCRGNERGQTFVVLGHGAAWRYAGSGRRCPAELERRIVEALRGLSEGAEALQGLIEGEEGLRGLGKGEDHGDV